MKEYEFTLPDGGKRYEFAANASEADAFKRMHGATGFHPVERGALKEAARPERTFSLRAEAACCIWEYFGECRFDGIGGDIGAAIRKRCEDFGTAEMRHVAINLAESCLDVYDAIPEAERDAMNLHSYDWDFCPAFVNALDWSGERPAPVVPPVGRIVATMLRNAAALAAANERHNVTPGKLGDYEEALREKQRRETGQV